MTIDKERVFWKTNKEWYFINNSGEYELTELAPLRAVISFKLYNSSRSMINEYKRICDKLGFDPAKDDESYIATEYDPDPRDNPFLVLTVEEINFLLDFFGVPDI